MLEQQTWCCFCVNTLMFANTMQNSSRMVPDAYFRHEMLQLPSILLQEQQFQTDNYYLIVWKKKVYVAEKGSRWRGFRLCAQSSRLRKLFLLHKGSLRFKGANWNPGYRMLCNKVHEGHSLKPMETLHRHYSLRSYPWIWHKVLQIRSNLGSQISIEIALNMCQDPDNRVNLACSKDRTLL